MLFLYMYICNKIHMSSSSYMQTHDFLTNVYEKSICCDLKAFVLLLLVFVFSRHGGSQRTFIQTCGADG